LPGISVKAGVSAVISGSRKDGPLAVLTDWPVVPAGRA
jgi:hypothetical protein